MLMNCYLQISNSLSLQLRWQDGKISRSDDPPSPLIWGAERRPRQRADLKDFGSLGGRQTHPGAQISDFPGTLSGHSEAKNRDSQEQLAQTSKYHHWLGLDSLIILALVARHGSAVAARKLPRSARDQITTFWPDLLS